MSTVEENTFVISMKPSPDFIAWVRLQHTLPYLVKRYRTYKVNQGLKPPTYNAAEKKMKAALLTLGEAGFDFCDFSLDQENDSLVYLPIGELT